MNKNHIASLGVVLLFTLVALIVLIVNLEKKEAPKGKQLEALAQCSVENETTFYGAFWCPNCASQKALFGPASKKLNYVECSNKDRSSKEVCNKENIRAYPTWKFKSGVVCSGVIDPIIVAGLSNCSYDHGLTKDELYKKLIENLFVARARSQKPDITATELEEAKSELKTNITEYLLTTHAVTLDTATLDQIVDVAQQYSGCRDQQEEKIYQEQIDQQIKEQTKAQPKIEAVDENGNKVEVQLETN